MMASIKLSDLPSQHGLRFCSPKSGASVFLASTFNQANSCVSSGQRLKRTAVCGARHRLLIVLASNSSPSGEESSKQKASDGDAGQGRPFLTILAGVFLFFLFWLAGSVLTWLLRLVAELLQPK